MTFPRWCSESVSVAHHHHLSTAPVLIITLRWCASRQGRTDPAANKGGPHTSGVALFWQHQVRHLRDRGVPAVRPGLRLGAVVSIPQPTEVLVGTTQPHSAHQVCSSSRRGANCEVCVAGSKDFQQSLIRFSNNCIICIFLFCLLSIIIKMWAHLTSWSLLFQPENDYHFLKLESWVLPCCWQEKLSSIRRLKLQQQINTSATGGNSDTTDTVKWIICLLLHFTGSMWLVQCW